MLKLLFATLLVTSTASLCLADSRRNAEKHIVFVIAEKEYATIQSLPKFYELELRPAGYRATFVTIANDASDPNDFSGLAEALSTADVCLISVRRRAPAAKDMAALKQFVADGKPLVGIRTASHAFHLRGKPAPEGHELWEELDPDILGGNYHGHYGSEPFRISVAESAKGHPILNAIGQIPDSSKQYKTGPLAKTAELLLVGQIEGKDAEPVAWTNVAGKNKARVFYTSMGLTSDFENAEFRKLLRNGVFWATNDDVNSTASQRVSNYGELIFVDRFERSESQETKDEPGNAWTTSSETRAAGNKQVDLRDGALHFWTHEVADHAVSVRHEMDFTDGTLQLRFRLEDSKDTLKLNFADPTEKSVHAGHLFDVVLALDQVTCVDRKTGAMNLRIREAIKAKSLSGEQKELLKSKQKSVKHDLAKAQWHVATVHIGVKRVRVNVDGEDVIEFESDGFAHSRKRLLRLLTPTQATIDDLRIWRRN